MADSTAASIQPLASSTTSPPIMPTSNEVRALTGRVTELTRANQELETQVADANRRAERLEEDLAQEKWDRNDDGIRTIGLVSQFEDTVALQREQLAKATGVDGAQLDIYQSQITQLQAETRTYQDANSQLKTLLLQERKSSSNTIQDLNSTIAKLQTDLATEQAKTQLQTGMSREDEINTRIREAKKDFERQGSETLRRYQSGIARTIHQQAEAAVHKKVAAMTQQGIERVTQISKAYENEKGKVAVLEQQLQEANQEVKWCKQQLQIASGSTLNAPAKNVGKLPTPPQHSPVPKSPVSNVDGGNKRRRLDSSRAFGLTTPDVQRVRSYSNLPSDPLTPQSIDNSIVASREDLLAQRSRLQNALRFQEQQAHAQQPMAQPMMTPDSQYRRQVFRQSTNPPSGPMTPCLQSQQYQAPSAIFRHPQDAFRIQQQQQQQQQQNFAARTQEPNAPTTPQQQMMQNAQYMTFQNMGVQPNGQAMFQMGINGPQRAPQPYFSPEQGISQAEIYNGLQLPQSNGMPMMLGSSFMPSAMPGGQRQTGIPGRIPQLVANNTQIHPSAQQTHNGTNNAQSGPERPAPASGRETPASHRSTPAARSRSARITPASDEPRNLVCINCHRNWWNETCEGQQPCTNCEGRDCVRPICPNDAAGTCDKGAKCKMVHKTDTQYHEPYLVDMKEFPKRNFRKADAQPAPSVLGKRKA